MRDGVILKVGICTDHGGRFKGGGLGRYAQAREHGSRTLGDRLCGLKELPADSW
jgi:hypothetical protein